jgi:hypothetical protein
MKFNLFNLDRSYVLVLKEEFHIILTKYSDISLTNNFLKNKRKIQKLHYLDVNSQKSCILTHMSHISFNSWTDITVIFASQFVYFAFETYMHTNHDVQHHNSKQSLTTFVENRLRNLSLNLHTKTGCYCHPEIILRIIRQYWKDTCTIHLTRMLLYCDYAKLKCKPKLFMKFCSFINTQLIFLPLLELDKFTAISFYDLDLFFNTQVVNYFSTNIANKWNLYEMQVLQLYNTLQVRRPTPVSKKLLYSAKYIRYNNNILFTLQGNKDLLITINHRFKRFYERRISSYQQYFAICNNIIPVKWLRIVVQKQQVIQEGQVVQYFSNLPIYLDSILTPITIGKDIIIRHLYTYKICNPAGYPLSKINWISLDDIQICRYFEQIYMTLYLIYSGSYNTNILQYLYYIIKYSYIKTIAFKHKKSFRFVLKFNYKFKMLVPIYNAEKISLLRIWHLNVLDINFF